MKNPVSGVFRSLRIFKYRTWVGGAFISSVGTWVQRTAQDWLESGPEMLGPLPPVIGQRHQCGQKVSSKITRKMPKVNHDIVTSRFNSFTSDMSREVLMSACAASCRA